MSGARLTVFVKLEQRGTGGPPGYAHAIARDQFARLPRQSAAGGPQRVDAVAAASGTLAAGASVEIDLRDGTLLDISGAGVVFAALVDFAAFVTSPGGLLRVGGTASANTCPLWFGSTTSYSTHGPLGPPFLQGDAGNPVAVDATHRKVKLANPHPTDAVSYQVVASGRL